MAGLRASRDADTAPRGADCPPAEAGPSNVQGVQTGFVRSKLSNNAASGGFRGVQQLHIDNLMAALQEALHEHDFPRISNLVAILIKALNPSNSMSEERPHAKKGPPTKGKENMKVTLLAGLEYLYHNPQTCSHNRLRHFLRNMQVMDSNSREAQLLSLEVGYLLLHSGQADQAHSLFINPPSQPAVGGLRSMLAVAAGQLRYQQWAQACAETGVAGRDAEDALPGMDQLEEGSREATGSQAVDETGSGSILGDFIYDELRWARSGREAHELWREAEASLREAHNLHPAVDVAYLLVSLYCAAGRMQQALDVVAKLRSDIGLDADAVALQILLLEASQAQDPHVADSLAEAYMDLMRCNPGSPYALDGLLSWHLRSSLDPEVLLEGLLLHLDGLRECARSGTAWSALASMLEDSALQAVSFMNQQDRGTASSMQHMRQEVDSHEVHTEQEESDHIDGNLDSVAWNQWTRILRALSSRKSWWPSMHFYVLPRASWLKDDPALADKAVCAAYIMGCQAGYCKAAARALHKGGDLDGAERIERAVGVVDLMLHAGYLHKDALQGSEFPTGGHGAPFGRQSAEFGTVVQLAQSWWRTFPRRLRESRLPPGSSAGEL